MTNDSVPGWTIHAEAVGEPGDVTDDALDRLADHLYEVGGAVSGAQDGSRYGATFSLDDITRTMDAATAAAQGYIRFTEAARDAGLPALPVVRLEAETYAEQDAELARPNFPELAGITEIAGILAVSRQRAHQLTKRPDFPVAVANLAAGPVWTRPSINHFVETWQRKIGRQPGDSLIVEPDLVRQVFGKLANVDDEAELNAILDRAIAGTTDEDEIRALQIMGKYLGAFTRARNAMAHASDQADFTDDDLEEMITEATDLFREEQRELWAREDREHSGRQ